jgi:exonuclease SbcD
VRILHTSDWHLGRVFHGAPLIDEQRAALARLVEIVAEERVELVVVAGDLYDRAVPPADAVRLLDETLWAIRRAGAWTVAVSGNHDSGVRVGWGERVMGLAGVVVRGDPSRAGEPVSIPALDGGPPVVVVPVPYLDPVVARHVLDLDAVTHEAALRAALTGTPRPDGCRTVVVAHGFVAGGQPSASERELSLGGADRVPVGCFAGFDYAALGHLHRAQVLGDEGRVRYSGSLLPYSFSEGGGASGAWLVDLPPAGNPRVEFVAHGRERGVATVEGDLAGLLAAPAHAAVEARWVKAIVTDQVLPPGAMARLQERFPHAVVLEHRPPVAPAHAPASWEERVRARTDLELVEAFLLGETGAEEVAEDDRLVIKEILSRPDPALVERGAPGPDRRVPRPSPA